MDLGPGHIELAGVVKSFDGFVNAVDGVNIKIPNASYCCLLGPSGCGKTTILRMIAGHEDPTAGEILIADLDTARRVLDREARARPRRDPASVDEALVRFEPGEL